MAGSFGLTGCFSLYPMKVLGGAGDGGILTTNDDGIAQQVRLLRDHNQDRAAGKILGFGYNSRLDNFHAALLSVKLRHLPEWINRRRQVAGLYREGLQAVNGVTLPPGPDNGEYFDVFQNYVIQSPRRDDLVAHLKNKGVETLISWPIPMHHHEALGLSRLRLPQTEKLSREVVSLPMNTEITDEQVAYVIEAVKGFHVK
jgi:dTDP-4-amino-4,6-dideoxygalactose transaminase